MNVFWVFVPGTVLLALGLIIFEWRNRRQQLSGAPSTAENANDESKRQVG